MTYRVRALRAAERQIERADAWWGEHRREAPHLFADELAAAVDVLETSPRIVQLAGYPHRDDVRAYTLPASKYRVFFVVSEDDRTVTILRVRHARKRPL